MAAMIFIIPEKVIDAIQCRNVTIIAFFWIELNRVKPSFTKIGKFVQ